MVTTALCACLQISEDELQEALQAAVVCTILAKAGPQRSRVLANLYKDERTHGLAPFPFMEKVYLERILRPDEVRRLFTPLGRHVLQHGSSAARTDQRFTAGQIAVQVETAGL